MSLLTKFFGRTASEGAAFALGTAVGPTLRPAVQELSNLAWHTHPDRPIDPVLAAQAVAQGQIGHDWAENEVRYAGINSERFDRLVAAFDSGPGIATAFQLWRRGVINEAGFRRAVKREGIENEWIDDLVEIRNVLLSPAELAMMRQQGFVDRARQHEESAKQGVDAERADLLFEISGLPPGVAQGLEMWRRDIIDEQTFAEIVREGHTKTKYTAALEVLKRVLLNPATVVNLFLRGWIDRPEYHARMDKWGYTAADADDWYDASGRPAAPVQMFTAWARGIDGPNGAAMNKAQFLKGIRESDIRPEWGEMLWGIRHNYPSLFQLRNAVQSGGINRARALTILRYLRYEDQDAVAIVDSWLEGSGTTAKGLTATDLATEYEGLFITRAQYIAGLRQLGYSADNAAAKADAEDAKRSRQARNATIARIHLQYVNHKVSRDQAVAALDRENVPPRARALILPEWDNERDINVATLTAAQVRKAYKDGIYTLAQAQAALEERGYSPTDANILLGVPPRHLTASQIARAYRLGLLAYEDALADLRGLGYSEPDAALVLGEAAPILTVAQIQEAYREQLMTYEQALAALERLRYSPADATILLEETGTRLTAAQVKKAWHSNIFTREQAIQRLEDLGYSPDDANTFLDE